MRRLKKELAGSRKPEFIKGKKILTLVTGGAGKLGHGKVVLI